jgi:hypothetical protein
MNHQVYWPGTNIPKSQGNAFDLRICPGELAREFKMSQVKAEAGLKGAQASQIRTYSKAVPGEWVH